ncbi:MAG: chromate transporter [Candidatus Contendobacter sp.]|jgi:chromate transporter|nr:chromate transporter [Gammaproteobacteria bacterium]MCC8992853.1 chromate transporter [Candidatus Contendobacter sp.]
MNDAPPNDAPAAGDNLPPPGRVTLIQIFSAFLLIGATSVGGGVVAYLRSSLVVKHRWIDDPTFVQMLSISQTLPGLNATNMAILVGDRLRGVPGALVAIVAICLPGGLIMFQVGMAYGLHSEKPFVTAMFQGIAAAAVGLVLAVTVQLGQKSLKYRDDLIFVALTVIGVNVFHLSVLYVLLGVGAFAVWWRRPRPDQKEPLL